MISKNSQHSKQSKGVFTMRVQHRKKWQYIETLKYYEFIQENRTILQQTEKKQKQRVYNRMSDYIGTRTTHQCRSHHQKVMKRHHTIDKFIMAFRKKKESMQRGQNSSKGNNSRVGTHKNLTHKINKTKLNFNQPLPSRQCRNLKIQQQLQPKSYQIYKQKKNFSELYSNIKDSQPIYDQQQQKPQTVNIRPSSGFYRNTCSTPQVRFNQMYPNQRYTPYDSSLVSKIDQTMILNKDKVNEFRQTRDSSQIEDIFKSQFDHEKFFDFNRIGFTQKGNFQNISSQHSYNLVNKDNNANILISYFNQAKYKSENSRPHTKTSTTNSEHRLIQNAHSICSSILQKKNFKDINPLVQRNMIQLTSSEIKIPYIQDENCKIWVECPNIDDVNEDQKFSYKYSDYKQAAKDAVINQSQKLQQIKKSQPPHFELTPIPNEQAIPNWHDQYGIPPAYGFREFNPYNQRNRSQQPEHQLSIQEYKKIISQQIYPRYYLEGYEDLEYPMEWGAQTKQKQQKTGTGQEEENPNQNHRAKQTYEKNKSFHKPHFSSSSSFSQVHPQHYRHYPQYSHFNCPENFLNQLVFSQQGFSQFLPLSYEGNFQNLFQKDPSRVYGFQSKYQKGNQMDPKYKYY